MPEKYETAILKWKAPEYIKHNKGPAWLGTAAVTAAAFVIYAIMTSEWIMALTFFTLALVYYVHQRQDPKEVEVIISEMGIKVGGQKFPFNQMSKFWIIYNPPFVKTLYISFAQRYKPDLVIQLDEQDPVKLRNVMLTQLPEWEGKEESAIDALIRAFKL
ncbi:MAG: hypothetical protein ABII07_02970 [Patescibacteria group bacterium]|nr:hypothetical protein [Patescibacteria group bacterium]